MVDEGDQAPDFTAALANGTVSEFTLSEQMPEAAPVVLAFYPGAFTSGCSHEMSTFQERLAEFQDEGATIYGVSTDLPFSQNEFRDELGLDFDMISDAGGDISEDYGVVTGYDHIGLGPISKRAVFVVDSDMTVAYAWVTDDPSVQPDYDDVFDAVAEAT